MEAKSCTYRIREFIQSVVEYYRMCSLQRNGPLTITRQMAGFALSDIPPAELDACLDGLARSGFIAFVDKEQKIFTPKKP